MEGYSRVPVSFSRMLVKSYHYAQKAVYIVFKLTHRQLPGYFPKRQGLGTGWSRSITIMSSNGF